MKKLQNIIRRYDVLLIMIGLLLLWEFLCYYQIIPSYLLPAPSQIITVLYSDRRLLLYHSSYTLLEALIGLFLGVLGGGLVAICMYYSPFLNRLFSPLMMLTQTIPSVAIAPLLILWLGYGMQPKILLIFLTCFFPIANSLLTGFQTADPDCLALLQSMNATRKQTFFSFLLPNALPDFFSGLRVASTYAIVGAVVAEWLGGERGLGVYMTRARKSFSFDRMFAVILIIVLLSQLLLLCIHLLQKRMMPWQSSTKKTKRSTMKRIVRTFSLTLILFLFVACQNTGPSLKTDQTEITVALDWVPNTNHTGLYVALEKGYYQDANLDVNIIQPAEDSAIPLVASNKADIGVSFQESLAFALEQDMPLTAIAAIAQHNDSGIISLKKSNINRPSDLANHRLATWNSDLFHAVIGQIVKDDHGNYDDIDLVYTDVADIQAALETNIDAVWVYYGWDGIALENANYETNYFSLRDVNPIFDFYTPILVANNDLLANQPEAARAFLLATAKGYEYAEQHPDEAADILLQYAPELDPDMIHASQAYMSKQYIDDATQWGIINASRWNSFYQWMYDASLIQTDLAQQDQTGFTNEFLPKEKE